MKDLRPRVAPGKARVPEVMEPEVLSPPATEVRPENYPSLRTSGAPQMEVLLDCSFRELVRYYRHSSCGQLCRGLVHRMNSPLQVLSFQLELLEQKSLEELKVLPEVGPDAVDKLQTLHRYRMKKIRQFRQELNNLQNLARAIILQGGHEAGEDCVALNLNEVYRRELDLYLAEPFFRHRVEKTYSFHEGLPPIYGHYIDFSQSFRNLLDNSLEAMENSGCRRLTVFTALENGCRLLYLGDTGPGIPPEIMPRIFEPFFTTKGQGPRGRAGLGLFMARRLLAPYGGNIRVDSIPGETWVTVELPM